MPDYLDTHYPFQSHPNTSYPYLLTKYLFEKFGIQKAQKLLEPGCGRGVFLSGFDYLGLECHGLDLSPEAENNSQNLKVFKANLELDTFPYPDNFFDVIYHKSLLEHLTGSSKMQRALSRRS